MLSTAEKQVDDEVPALYGSAPPATAARPVASAVAIQAEAPTAEASEASRASDDRHDAITLASAGLFIGSAVALQEAVVAGRPGYMLVGFAALLTAAVLRISTLVGGKRRARRQSAVSRR